MNTAHIESKFEQIGAGFVFEELSVPQYWQVDAVPYSLRVNTNRRGRPIFVLGVIPKARDYVQMSVHTVDKRAKQLVFSLKFFNENHQFLCGDNEGRWDVEEIPPGPAGIRRAVDMLNAEKRKKQDEVERAHQEKARKPPKKRRIPEIASFEDVKKSIEMSLQEYQFYRLLVEKCQKMKLYKGERHAIAQYGSSEKNTFRFALMRIAAVSQKRRRDLKDWTPKTHNAHKQYGSLVRHLFAQYPVPDFMDSVWFRDDDTWIPWFIEIGSGANIRKVAGFPIAYTKKMAHNMFQSPRNYSIEQAIRWGQVSALGGGLRFFNEIQCTRIAPIGTIGQTHPDRHAFWQTVIEWFLRHPMLDPVHFGPIVDYIEHQKFSPPRENPDFEITGRSPQAILHLVNQWHGALGKASRRKQVSWPCHGLDWQWEQKTRDDVTHAWEVREILDSHALLAEGRGMRHCVYTYTDSCAKGQNVILSLRCDGKRLLTVQFLPHQQRLGEIRGSCNRRPKNAELNVLSRWAKDKGLEKAWLLI